jgi:hypothetical protein
MYMDGVGEWVRHRHTAPAMLPPISHVPCPKVAPAVYTHLFDLLLQPLPLCKERPANLSLYYSPLPKDTPPLPPNPPNATPPPSRPPVFVSVTGFTTRSPTGTAP